jgi:hypothetical protein
MRRRARRSASSQHSVGLSSNTKGPVRAPNRWPANRPTDQNLAGHQSQDRQNTGSEGAASAGGPRRRGHRVRSALPGLARNCRNLVGQRMSALPRVIQTSTCSAMARASSTSMRRYLSVLSAPLADCLFADRLERPSNVDRRGRDLLQAFPSEQRIKHFEARVLGTRGIPCRSGAHLQGSKGAPAAASCA